MLPSVRQVVLFKRRDPILSIFAEGSKGGAWDFTNTAKMFTTSAGSTNAVALGDAIGRVEDLSPNGLHLTETDSANSRLPTLMVRGGAKFAHGDGSRTRMQSAAVDLSGTAVITVVLGVVKGGDTIASYIVANLNNTSPTGTFAINAVDAANGNRIIFQGKGAGFDGYYVTAQSPSRLVLSVVHDIAAASLATRLKPRVNGSIPSLTAGGTSGQGTVFASGNKITFFSDVSGANSKIDLYRAVVIARALTPAEILMAEEWVSTPIAALPSLKALVLGDSTVTGILNTVPVSHFIDRLAANVIATINQTTAQQKAQLDAMTAFSQYGVIIVQVGLNDLAPAEAASVAIARIQALIDDVNTKKAGGAKVIIGTMTPCRAFLISTHGGVNGPIAYQKWLDMNEAISGGGGSPITGVDARATAHTAALNDGSGNLAATYNIDNLHENIAGRQIVASSWDAALTSVGL